MESVKKSIDKRAQHKRESMTARVNERPDSDNQRLRSVNDAMQKMQISDPYMMKSQMVEVHTTADIISLLTGQQHTEATLIQ
ncbi:hypothetical protein Tco_1054911 [Tanacetum coccineum]|uniref:Uncharacterized protein n=1 Tax=Tanacetum coccineum TaxID=301880 RepID=A0ABQ5GZ40_9ASTR